MCGGDIDMHLQVAKFDLIRYASWKEMDQVTDKLRKQSTFTRSGEQNDMKNYNIYCLH